MAFKGSRPVLRFLLLLLATLAWVARTAAQPADCATVIHVAVNGTDSTACVQGHGSCRTLHYAFTNCTITSSTQFLIGPGTFNLTQDLGTIYDTPFSRLEGLVVKGSGAEETIIDCLDASGLAFVNMTNLMISDLTLFNCSQNRPSTSIGNVSEPHTVPFQVGLYIWRCSDVVIENVHINETIGVGLVLYETVGRVSVNSSVFHHNGIPENMTDTLYGGGGVNVEFPYCPPGHYNDDECGKYSLGAEYVFKDCNFTNNTAHIGLRYSEQFITQERSSHQSFGRGGGMAIYFSGNSSDKNVNLTNCHFIGNAAAFGGGMLGEFNDRARYNSLNLINCSFTRNTCFNSTQVNGGGGGGARLGFLLYEANSVANNEIHIETTLFEQNTAYLGGGVSFVTGYEQGVLAPTNRFVMMSPIFKHNVARLGSAVNLMPWKSPSGLVTEVQIVDGMFIANSVLYNNDSWYLMGFGTVYSYKVPFDIIKGPLGTYFQSNNGSGIVVVGTGVNVRSGSAIGFSYNFATNGGGIAAYANGWLMLWNGTRLNFTTNKAQSRGGAIYSESTGGNQIVESSNCVIRYFEWWRRYEEWDSELHFDQNFAHEAGDDIFVSSLFPCIRSGSNGSADTSVVARRKVFRATPTFKYSNLTNNSIVTGAADIKFKANVSRDDLHISVYPGQVFNLTTKIKPLDELEALSQVPFFVTTNISNNGLPAAVVDPNSVYTTGYLQFQAGNSIRQEHGNVNTTVQLQTVSEPALQFSFNMTLSECPPGSYLNFPNNTRPGQCACARNSNSGYLAGIVCYEHSDSLSIFRQGSMWYGTVSRKAHSMNISVSAPCPFYCDYSNSVNNLVPLDLTDPTSGICRGQSHGILCGTCDHGLLITSHTFECCTLEERQAISELGAWALWLFIQYSLTTVIVVIVILFDFDVIGGALCSFVFFSQVVLDLNLQYCTSGLAYEVIVFIQSFYAVWSLRFRWLSNLIPSTNFCMPTFSNTLEALTLDYAFALYPFVLIATGCCISWCSKREKCTTCCQKMFACCKDLFRIFRQLLAQRTSLANGIATCLILTYGDLVSISFFLLTPVQLSVPYNTSSLDDIEGGSWRSLYHGDYAYFGFPHCLYGIGAAIAVVIFGFLPPFFLMSYPALPQVLRKYILCRGCCARLINNHYYKKIWNVVKDSLELFQRNFVKADDQLQARREDEYIQFCSSFVLKDRRFYAGMWLIYRLALHANNAFAPDCTTSLAVQICLGVVFLLIHSILRPNKETKYNIVDSLLFANITVLSALGMVFNVQEVNHDVLLAIMGVCLLWPYLYFIGVIIYRIVSCSRRGYRWYKGQEDLEVQPLVANGEEHEA